MKPLTALLGLIFLATLFFILPWAFVQLNSALGWPRWDLGVLVYAGWALILVGAAISLQGLRLFQRLGGGTPVPTQPPQRLVTDGLFGYSRNPIFVADVVIVTGIFLIRGESALLLYTFLIALLLQVFVLYVEEPTLAKRYGDDWTRYTQHVPRWIGS